MDESIHNHIQEGDLLAITTYQAGVLQASAHRLLQKTCDDYLARFGLTKTQWLALGIIADAGQEGMRPTEIAEALGTTMAFVTKIMLVLESGGMITRKETSADSRSRSAIVHPEFVPQISEIEAGLRQALRAYVYRDITPEEFRIYMRVLLKLSQ